MTCKTEQKSIISDECSTGIYPYKRKKIPFSTCRKFKGLEADVIILIDIDKEVTSNNSEQIMYVGSSRARFKLAMISSLSSEECVEILESLGNKKSKNPEKAIATLYNAKHKKTK